MILFIGIFMGVLTLISSILVVKCIEKFLLTMESIMEWAVEMSTYSFFRVQYTYSVVN